MKPEYVSFKLKPWPHRSDHYLLLGVTENGDQFAIQVISNFEWEMHKDTLFACYKKEIER